MCGRETCGLSSISFINRSAQWLIGDSTFIDATREVLG